MPEASLRALSDDALVARTQASAAQGRRALAALVASLAELDRRNLHLVLGHGSLYAFARAALRLSEQEAYLRMTAARVARRFPSVLPLLAEGDVGLATLRLLAPHLTEENHAEVLQAARGLSRPAVEELVARLCPAPDPPPELRGMADEPAGLLARPIEDPPPDPRRAQVRAVAHERYRLQVTIDAPTREKLRLARDMLSHALPTGDDAALLDRALTALVEGLARTKFAATDSPRPPRPTAPGSRHVPAEVKRTVWLRDLGRCAFVAADGRRCEERRFVEFHHVRPHAAGGAATARNIELRCRRHNAYEAEVHFGAGVHD